MNSIKLALIRQKYRPDGGAERFLARAIDALKDDVELTIFTRKWQEQNGVHVVKCNPPKWSRVSREKGFAKKVCQSISQKEFDLIQSHERVPCCDIYRAGDGIHKEWLVQRDRIISPIARFITKITPFHNYALEVEKQLFNSPQLKAVICNSKMVQNEIKSYFPAAAHKTRVIYSSVDFSIFSPNLKQHSCRIRKELGISESETIFLFVGSGFERKGLAATIKALAKTKRAKLIVIGKDKRQIQYQKLADQLGVGGRVLFLGVKNDVTSYYGAADAFVFPTLYDPFPNVIIEALASGLPVITSTKCGAAEIIDQGRDGFVCDSLDTDSIADYMHKLQGSSLLREMSDDALEKSKIFSTKNMTKQLTKLYSGLIENKTAI